MNYMHSVTKSVSDIKVSLDMTTKVYEIISVPSIKRCLDPQSGCRIIAQVSYKVVENHNGELTVTENMSMEELYDKYPWFFEEETYDG